jgi:hypothetical protein
MQIQCRSLDCARDDGGIIARDDGRAQAPVSSRASAAPCHPERAQRVEGSAPALQVEIQEPHTAPLHPQLQSRDFGLGIQLVAAPRPGSVLRASAALRASA